MTRLTKTEERALANVLGAAHKAAERQGILAVAVIVVLPSGLTTQAMVGDEALALARLAADGPTTFAQFVERIAGGVVPPSNLEKKGDA